MSATATLPLPLELAEPKELTCDRETHLKELLDVAKTRYNPETQVREDLEGIPQIFNQITISVIVSTAVLNEAPDSDNANDDTQ